MYEFLALQELKQECKYRSGLGGQASLATASKDYYIEPKALTNVNVRPSGPGRNRLKANEKTAMATSLLCTIVACPFW